MDHRLQGKVAIVTAGGSTLPRALARVGWALLSTFFEPPVIEPLRWWLARLAPHRPCNHEYNR